MGGYYREMTDRNYENCNSQNLRIGMENRGEIAQLPPRPKLQEEVEASDLEHPK